MKRYNDFTRALAYERIAGTRVDIPDARLGVGSAEILRSLPKQNIDQVIPKRPKVDKVKTDDDIKYLGEAKTFTQMDFDNTGYIGEVL